MKKHARQIILSTLLLFAFFWTHGQKVNHIIDLPKIGELNKLFVRSNNVSITDSDSITTFSNIRVEENHDRARPGVDGAVGTIEINIFDKIKEILIGIFNPPSNEPPTNQIDPEWEITRKITDLDVDTGKSSDPTINRIEQRDDPPVEEVISVKIYPNPTADYLFIDNIKDATLLLSDIKGQILLQQMVNTEQVQLNLSNYPSGIYLLLIVKKGQRVTHEIIKQ